MGTQLATIVVTDMVGSTATRVRVGEDAADDVRRAHDEIVRDTVEANHGRVVKSTGDGILACFSGAADAVTAAVEAQTALAAHNRRISAEPIEVRMGISAGDVNIEGEDVFGTPVIEASRLCAAADGGAILTSDVIRVLAAQAAATKFGGSATWS